MELLVLLDQCDCGDEEMLRFCTCHDSSDDESEEDSGVDSSTDGDNEGSSDDSGDEMEISADDSGDEMETSADDSGDEVEILADDSGDEVEVLADDSDDEVEILAERIGRNWTPLVSLAEKGKCKRDVERKPLNNEGAAEPELSKPYKPCDPPKKESQPSEDSWSSTNEDAIEPEPSKPPKNRDASTEKEESQPSEDSWSSTNGDVIEPEPSKPPKTGDISADREESRPSEVSWRSLWDRIQNFKANSKTPSTTIKRERKRPKVSNTLEGPELQKLIAQMEMMKLNREFSDVLNASLHSQNFLPYETENLMVSARESVMSRWSKMSAQGIYVVIFSEGFCDRLHPNYWGNKLNEDLLEKLHEQEGRINKTLYSVEKEIRGQDIVNLEALKTGKIHRGEIASGCVANFLHTKIFARSHGRPKSMQLVQEGLGKRMTCFIDQASRTHAHKKEVWCSKYDL